jgi:phage FluMu protein Com
MTTFYCPKCSSYWRQKGSVSPGIEIVCPNCDTVYQIDYNTIWIDKTFAPKIALDKLI